MNGLMFEWWVWAIAALILAILEILAPAFLLLGLAIGAGCIAVLLLIGGPAFVGGSLPLAFLIWAVLSLLAWFGLRRVFDLPGGSKKTFNHDIND